MTRPIYSLLILAVAAVALLVSGCSNGAYWTWRHPQGLDDAALQRDKGECQAMATNELNRFDYYRPFAFSPFYYDRNYRTNHFRPYYPLNSYDYRRYAIDLNQLYRFCLHAKGWQPVRIDIAQPEKSK